MDWLFLRLINIRSGSLRSLAWLRALFPNRENPEVLSWAMEAHFLLRLLRGQSHSKSTEPQCPSPAATCQFPNIPASTERKQECPAHTQGASALAQFEMRILSRFRKNSRVDAAQEEAPTGRAEELVMCVTKLQESQIARPRARGTLFSWHLP